MSRTIAAEDAAAMGVAGPLAKIINIASVDGLSLNPLKIYAYHASKVRGFI